MSNLPDKIEYAGRNWSRQSKGRWMKRKTSHGGTVVFRDSDGNTIRVPAGTTLKELMEIYNVREVRLGEETKL